MTSLIQSKRLSKWDTDQSDVSSIGCSETLCELELVPLVLFATQLS